LILDSHFVKPKVPPVSSTSIVSHGSPAINVPNNKLNIVHCRPFISILFISICRSFVGKMHTSLFYQVITFFNLWFLGSLTIIECLLLIFKATYLPYPGSYLTCDIILIAFALLLEYFRIDLSRSGNLTERQVPIVASLILSIATVLGSVYIFLWQTYVLRLELILASIQLVFQGIEILYSLILIIGFHKKSSLI
jgi:transmembrane protein 216